MTTTPERRTATLSELVAQEIDAIRGRRRMSQAQLARAMGKNPMWVSLRLRGVQPIDLNDMMAFARALDVEVHTLMPSPEEVARASVSVWNPSVTIWPTFTPLAPRQRPPGRKDSRRPERGRRTGRLPRPDLPEAI